MNIRKKLAIILISMFFYASLYAETVMLNSEEKVEEKIIEKIDGRRIVPPYNKTDCVPTENYSIIGKWEQTTQPKKGSHIIFEFLENGDFLMYDLYDIEDTLPEGQYNFTDKNHIAINIRKQDGTIATINEEIYFSRDGKAQMKGDITQAKYKFVNKSRIEIDGFYKSDNVSKKSEFEICFTKDGILKLMYLSPDEYDDSNLYYERVLE